MKTKEENEYKIVGRSLENLKLLIDAFAEEKTNLILYGKRGTGKELFAKHYFKHQNECVTVNCAGRTDELLHSELFGHKKGAFTDAKTDRLGLFPKCAKSKKGVFLDEFGDASVAFQGMLLRVVECGNYKVLGEDEDLQLNAIVPVVVATSKIDSIRPDLQDRFRIIYLPDLSERKKDITELLIYFCNKYDIEEISVNALAEIKKTEYDGNIRELEKVVREARVLCKLRGESVLRTEDIIKKRKNIHLVVDEKPDKSKVKHIKELRIHKSQPLPREFFLRQTHNDLLKEKLSKTTDAQKIHGVLNRMVQKLDDLVSSIATMQSHGEREDEKNTLNDLFESMPPKDYDSRFWDYHKKEGTNQNALAKMTGVHRNTVSTKIKEARKRNTKKRKN